MYDTLYAIVNKSENATLQYFIFSEKVFDEKYLLLDFSFTVKAATLIFISGCGSAISSPKEGKSGFIYNLV